MTMSGHLIRIARFAVVLVVAAIVGVVATIGVALVGHEALVMAYGEDLAPIDDTLLMLVVVLGAYLAGIVSGLIVLVGGWRRVVRRPHAGVGPRHRVSR